MKLLDLPRSTLDMQAVQFVSSRVSIITQDFRVFLRLILGAICSRKLREEAAAASLFVF